MRKALDPGGLASAGYLFQRISTLMGNAKAQADQAAESSNGMLQNLRNDPESVDFDDLRGVAEDAIQSIEDVQDNAKSSLEYANRLVAIGNGEE